MAPLSSTRPTLRTIAAAAEVSAMTVSLALRHHPRIPEETRRLVQRVADKLGYRPDPQVAKLMQHLRVRRKPVARANLAALTTITAQAELPYLRDMIAAARRRAEELGYSFSLFRLEDAPAARPDIQRVLRSRGVDGVMLLPIANLRGFADLLDWSEVSVVCTTYAVLAPTVHRVVPHHLLNALRICRKLAASGYRRIGIVLPREHDLRVNHGFSAAVAWHGLVGGTEVVRPLLHEGHAQNAAELRAWFTRERPDAIIASGDKDCRSIATTLGLRVPGAVGFASANKAERSVFAGIDEQPDEIGATAIEQLASMIERGDKGVPRSPKVTMVEGRWVDGNSV